MEGRVLVAGFVGRGEEMGEVLDGAGDNVGTEGEAECAEGSVAVREG